MLTESAIRVQICKTMLLK